MQCSHFWGAHPVGVGAFKAPYGGTGPTGGCSRDALHWGVHPSGPGQVPSGVGTARSPLGLVPSGHPIIVCLYLSLSAKDLATGQLVTLGDRCAILPDVLSLLGLSLSLACAAGKSLDVPAWKCSFLTVSDSEFLCLALLIPQLGQSSPVWSCCGFTGLIWSCLKNTLVLHVWFGDRRAWIFLGMCW